MIYDRFRMMMRIAVANHKGGVGKTTTAINLGTYLALKGKRVLLIDLDPQACLTLGLGIDASEMDTTAYELFLGKNVDECIIETEVERLHLIPSKLDLAGAEVELTNEIGREFILSKALKKLEGYDYVLVDCPPNLGLFTINAMVACRNVLVPVQAEYFPLKGVDQLERVGEKIREGLDIPVKFRYLITMVNQRTKLGKDVIKEIREKKGDVVFKTVIPRNVKLAEAPSHGKPIALYDPECKGALAYSKLAEEVMTLEWW